MGFICRIYALFCAVWPFGPKDSYVYYSSTFTAPGASYDLVHILMQKGAHYRGARWRNRGRRGVINLYNRGRGLVFWNLRSPADFRKFLWKKYVKIISRFFIFVFISSVISRSRLSWEYFDGCLCGYLRILKEPPAVIFSTSPTLFTSVGPLLILAKNGKRSAKKPRAGGA